MNGKFGTKRLILSYRVVYKSDNDYNNNDIIKNTTNFFIKNYVIRFIVRTRIEFNLKLDGLIKYK